MSFVFMLLTWYELSLLLTPFAIFILRSSEIKYLFFQCIILNYQTAGHKSVQNKLTRAVHVFSANLKYDNDLLSSYSYPKWGETKLIKIGAQELPK